MRQTHPTTQSQWPQYQATPYNPLVSVPKRVPFTSDPEASVSVSSSYLDIVKASSSRGRQPQSWSTERRSSSTAAGTDQPHDASRGPHSRSRQRKSVGPTIVISETLVEVVPKDPTVYPSAGWLCDAMHLTGFSTMKSKICPMRRKLRLVSKCWTI